MLFYYSNSGAFCADMTAQARPVWILSPSVQHLSDKGREGGDAARLNCFLKDFLLVKKWESCPRTIKMSVIKETLSGRKVSR